MAAPTVSVIIPALNAAPFLGEAIASILSQGFSDLELIVIDDGSSDGSQVVAASYAAADRRVRTAFLERDPRTESGARAANVGIDMAQGALIARMDADDIATPDRFAIQTAWLRDHDLDVCGGQARRFGEQDGELWYPYGAPAIAHELVFRSGLANATMLARGEVLRAARFSETEAYEEYELQTRLISQVRIGNCPDVVLGLRVHPGQTTRVLGARKQQSRQRLRFGHFFRLFPDARLEDFRCVNAVARGTPLGDNGELRLAADWLVRLSRLPDEKLRNRMARRWADVCERYAGPPADLGLRDDVADRVLAAP
jgi:glycosyltransferase involved in cell wall biosynthesis